MTSEILLDTASEVVQRSVGLRLDPAQRHRLDYWLHHTAEQRGVPDQTIVEEIAAEGPALQACLDELTVQETSFFRDPVQVAAFRRDVVPTLHSPLTVWSAGCAWGHEPYTIAMVLAESGIAEWQVVASDISSRALRQAASGRYEERQLTGLGETERSRYLRKAGDQWEIVPELRSKVTVFRHNLIRDPALAQAAGAEVVFCRNVLIYFDRHDVLAALERIATTMDPRGWVFFGYSESLWQVTERFHLVRVGTAFAYRQPDPAMAAPAAGVLPLADHSNHSGSTSKRTKAPVPAGASLGSAHAPSTPSRPPAESAPSQRPSLAAVANLGGGDPSIAALLAEGEAGLQSGDAAAAVAALRKVAYLDPDHAIAHFQLGLAFELLGESRQARRAFSVARAALRRSSAAAEVALEGYQIGELIRMIDHRLTRTPEP
jgi:chemotaxis methyl-accepting protein methylase